MKIKCNKEFFIDDEVFESMVDLVKDILYEDNMITLQEACELAVEEVHEHYYGSSEEFFFEAFFWPLVAQVKEEVGSLYKEEK